MGRALTDNQCSRRYARQISAACLACAISGGPWLPHTGQAAEILFRDDFSGAIADEWMIQNHAGSRSVTNGWYEWTPTANMVMNSAIEGFPKDVSLRTRVRLLGDPQGDWIFLGLGGRDQAPNDGGMNYFAGITTDGRIGIGISGVEVLVDKATPLDVRQQDVELQFDMLGSQLSLTAWEAGTPRELGTHVSIVDETDLVGSRVYLAYNPRAATLVPAAFDYFEVVAIPEPSTGLLALLAAGLCFSYRSRFSGNRSNESNSAKKSSARSADGVGSDARRG